ncbi:MAG: glycosyltransferase 87 family protein [Bacteroidota bacterium]
MMNHHQASRITSIIVFIIAIASIGLSIERYQSVVLMGAYFTAFFCYLWMVRLERNLTLLIGIGVIARLTLFFDVPHLSDDVFRFLWDGKLIELGINPFQFRPNELPTVDPELYTLLNSQIHYTVYPPFNQALFWLAATTGGNSYLLGTNVLRFFLLLAEIGSLFLLFKLSKQFHQPTKIAAWYFLNPLVILEIVGNVHFEGFVIFFLLLMLYALTKNKFISGGIALGMAAAAKLIPLIFLPFLLLKHQWRNGIIISGAAIAIFFLTIYPLFDIESLQGFQKSLMLYSSKFEFNASIYFIIREIGWLIKGYNPIETWGPWLSFSTFLSIVLFSLYAASKDWNISKSLFWILIIYLLLATTVHPWYILTLLPLGLLSGYYFPIIWSFMVFLTYIGYHEKGFELSMTWVVVEYTVVILAAAIELMMSKYSENG